MLMWAFPDILTLFMWFKVSYAARLCMNTVSHTLFGSDSFSVEVCPGCNCFLFVDLCQSGSTTCPQMLAEKPLLWLSNIWFKLPQVFFPHWQILIEFCAGGAVDAVMLGKTPLLSGTEVVGTERSSWKHYQVKLTAVCDGYIHLDGFGLQCRCSAFILRLL